MFAVITRVLIALKRRLIHEGKNKLNIKPDAVMDYRKEKQLSRLESKKKIFLPIGSKAEDILKTLRLTKDTTSGYMQECSLDGSGSDDSVVSGPSSPSAALHSLRCRGCERLFNKMRRQEPPRKNRRADNPASLSCDEWLLKKRWQPQRRQQVRGRLWVHLKRIRLHAANQSDDRMANRAWEPCSRPHVFLQRNLRLCKKFFGKPSKSKAKPLHQQRNRAKPTRLQHREKYQRRKKRKSIETDDTSEHLSVSSDLTVTSEDKLPGNDLTHQEDLQQFEKVSKKQSVSDASGLTDVQANGDGLEGTRRVLKFDTSLSDVLAEETHKTKLRFVSRSAGGQLHEGQSDVTVKRLDDGPSEDSDVFRTPTDLFSTDLRISRKSKSPHPFGVQKNSFRTMLAALGRGHNRIIKESHH